MRHFNSAGRHRPSFSRRRPLRALCTPGPHDAKVFDSADFTPKEEKAPTYGGDRHGLEEAAAERRKKRDAAEPAPKTLSCGDSMGELIEPLLGRCPCCLAQLIYITSTEGAPHGRPF